MDNFLPIPYFFACLLATLLALRAWAERHSGWGLPMGAVIFTTSVWYLVDPVYNDYETYVDEIGLPSLDAASWQICLFLTAFSFFTPAVSRKLAGPFVNRKSSVIGAIRSGRFHFWKNQVLLERLFVFVAVAWLLLMAVAMFRINFQFQGLFFPYLQGYRADPWARNRIGGGIDAILSLASYFQLFLTASFGVFASILRRHNYRNIAIVLCFLAFPYYLIDRTRNTMLAILIPGLLSFVFLRLKSNTARFMVLTSAFFALSLWFAVVMAERSERSIASVLTQGVDFEKASQTKHLGLNMFEELGWVNHFISEGSYNPNWGQRYFAELVNPIPRSLWPGKPLIGIDYAVARGQGGGSNAAGGVFATISTGMIGQGVVNFGIFVGPIAAAFLMALWVGVLARQDLDGRPSRMLLYVIGLILTFNLGRDITLITLYPFIFGYIAIRFWERYASAEMDDLPSRATARFDGVQRPQMHRQRRF